MIRLSRFRLSVLAACTAALAVSCGEDPGTEPRMCTAIGCLEGLNVRFAGTPQLNKTYQVTLSIITVTPETVPFMTCETTRGAEGATSLACASAFDHKELGDRVQIPHAQHDVKKLLATVVLEGAKQSEKMFEVTYASNEINGAGCGVCTTAQVEVELR